MNSKTLSHKLLYPNDSSKKRKIVDDEILEEVVEKEFSCFYKK
jgi:hypothetical protein